MINNEIKSNEEENKLDKVKEDEEKNDILNYKDLFENVKSKYIIQKIFSYTDEKVKFKSIKYDKKLQNKNDISLIYYNLFSGRYIIYETKAKGKEYSNFLRYKGEYLKGKKHGKGK